MRDPKARMAVVWAHCKSKMICEADEPKEEDGEAVPDAEPKKGHGGCGHVQPLIRKEGLKLFLVYKKSKDEDEMVTKAVQSCLHLTRRAGCQTEPAGQAAVRPGRRVQHAEEDTRQRSESSWPV